MPIFTLFGDIKRINRSAIPEIEGVFTVFGDVKLDFTRVPLAPGEHTLRLGTIFGDVELRVPEDVGLAIEGFTLFSDVDLETEPQGEEERPGVNYRTDNFASAPVRITLDVFGLFGDVEITRVGIPAGAAYQGETYRLEQRDNRAGVMPRDEAPVEHGRDR